MFTFSVVRKSDSQEVYRYEAESDSPVAWSNLGFDEYDYVLVTDPGTTPVSDPIIPSEWRINVGHFFDRFGAYKIPILSHTNSTVQAIIKDCSVRMYVDLYQKKAEIGSAVDAIASITGYPISKSAIIDVKPSPEEVYKPLNQQI